MKNKKRILFVSTVAVFVWCLAPQASAGDCDCNNGPCIPCNGLEQTPDYRNLTEGQDTVPEDDLNAPWIETIKRVKQCAGAFRNTAPAIDFDAHDPGDEGEMSLSAGGLHIVNASPAGLLQATRYARN